MLLLHIVFLSVLLTIAWSARGSFPPNFEFGASTSSIQIEGGWNADGKGVNIWDKFVHDNPGSVKNNGSADVAADSYRLWREDVKAAAQMKINFYRLSISWTRVLPTGFTNEINDAGVKYYNDLIDALLAEGIEPVVTIFHWELPVKIQDLGGWTNPLIAKWFAEYARVLYTLYGDRVKTWLTINEAGTMCDYFYNTGDYAPGVKEPVHGPFLCNKHVMLAHAAAYRVFDEEFRPKYTGRISLPSTVVWLNPTTPNDTAMAELGREYLIGRYAHPIFSKEGGWPPAIEKLMLEVSLKQGYSASRLPKFTKEEIEFVKGTADFFGVNYYTTYLIRASKPGDNADVWFATGSPELQATLSYPPDAYYGATPIYPVYPTGLRDTLAWLKRQYGDIDVLITENGYSTTGHQLQDYDRIQFIQSHLEQILVSITEDNVNVIGYTAWSLIDTFEWLDGYTTKFGLYEVDFEHPNRTRTPRLSALYYSCVVAHRTPHVPDYCYNK